jgi:membrane carboxypeptidase/penicillin-binding protein
MIELAEAFGVLANQGVRIPLTGILEISNYKGEVLEQYDPESSKTDLAYLTENDLVDNHGVAKRVMARAPAYLTNHIMQDNNARQHAFGTNSELVIKNKVVSAKTGTTNDLKDNWTVGYTPEYLTIVWVGNNNSKSMSYLASGVTGAAPIWHDIMAYILKDQNPLWPDKPADVKIANVCLTGMPAEAGLGTLLISSGEDENSVATTNPDTDPIASCEAKGQELYWEDSKPSYSGTFRKEYWIRAETGLPPLEGEEASDLKLEEHSFYYDPLTKLYCADCSRPLDEKGEVIYEQNIIDVKDIF